MRRLDLIYSIVLTALLVAVFIAHSVNWNRLLHPLPSVPSADPPKQPISRAKNAGDLRAFLAAPVFDPERQPLDASIGMAAQTETGLDELELVGIVRSGESAFVVVRKPSDGNAWRMKVGESYAGYRLMEIATSEVTFLGPTGQLKKRLKRER